MRKQLSLLSHRGELFARDHAEGEGVDDGHRAKTRSAVHAARDFAARKESLNRLMRLLSDTDFINDISQ